MRVLIEVDGTPATLTSGAPGGEGTWPGSVTDAAPADGGSAPGHGGADGSGQPAEADTGPPPQWLLDAISEAEAAGLDPAMDDVPIDAGGTVDAGAAPAVDRH
jgi:hypothetical protein